VLLVKSSLRIHRDRVAPLVSAIALGLLIFGVQGYGDRARVTNNPNPQIPSEVVVSSSIAPDETPLVDVCDRYQVGSDLPRKIEIPSIGVGGCIQKVGVDEANAIAVPSNIHLAGWYVDSVKPGEVGTSIIAGHVRGRYKGGSFVGLSLVKLGALILFQNGDGSWRDFMVESAATYTVAEGNAQLFAESEDDMSRLTLITCEGQPDSEGKYPERVFVKAILVN